jgi:hypothetical protein
LGDFQGRLSLLSSAAIHLNELKNHVEQRMNFNNEIRFVNLRCISTAVEPTAAQSSLLGATGLI